MATYKKSIWSNHQGLLLSGSLVKFVDFDLLSMVLNNLWMLGFLVLTVIYQFGMVLIEADHSVFYRYKDNLNQHFQTKNLGKHTGIECPLGNSLV